MKTVFISGKFAAQRTTGVQRAATCIVEALDQLMPSTALAGRVRFVLLCPPHAEAPAMRNIEVRRIGPPGVNLHLWEQLLLPWATRGAMLLNLGGSAPLMKRRQVCTFHDAAMFDFPQAHTWAFRAWYRFLFRRVARKAPLLLTVSEFSKSRLVECLGIAPGRVTVMAGSGKHMLPVAGDPAVLGRLGLRSGAYFVAVGSANPTKNFPALLAAFAALPPRCDAQLVVVGGENRGVFAPEARATGGARVVRAGAISDEELKALYQSALGLVFPSLYEGFGLPPLEAMSCGCPVAASSAASIPEVCGDAVLYFDPYRPDSIGAAMMRLFDEPQLRDQLRQRGAERAAGFGWDAAAHMVLHDLDLART